MKLLLPSDSMAFQVVWKQKHSCLFLSLLLVAFGAEKKHVSMHAVKWREPQEHQYLSPATTEMTYARIQNWTVFVWVKHDALPVWVSHLKWVKAIPSLLPEGLEGCDLLPPCLVGILQTFQNFVALRDHLTKLHTFHPLVASCLLGVKI